MYDVAILGTDIVWRRHANQLISANSYKGSVTQLTGRLPPGTTPNTPTVNQTLRSSSEASEWAESEDSFGTPSNATYS
ncbi:unnamed protein product, partial [Iphiclides podalirius]